jgi:hypothetical protein
MNSKNKQKIIDIIQNSPPHTIFNKVSSQLFPSSKMEWRIVKMNQLALIVYRKGNDFIKNMKIVETMKNNKYIFHPITYTSTRIKRMLTNIHYTSRKTRTLSRKSRKNGTLSRKSRKNGTLSRKSRKNGTLSRKTLKETRKQIQTRMQKYDNVSLYFFEYDEPITTLRDIVMNKKIRDQPLFERIFKNIVKSYGLLHQNYGFRMYNIDADHIFVSPTGDVYWFGFNLSEINEMKMTNSMKTNIEWNHYIHFSNHLNIEWNKTFLNIFKSNKTGIRKLKNKYMDIIRILLMYNTMQNILFINPHQVHLNYKDIAYLNDKNILFVEKIYYLYKYFDEIFIGYHS